MKKKVLFVDDEKNILRGIQRMLYSMRSEWHMFFANSGKEAISILEEHDMDIVVTDMRMPEMDGNQLLDYVRAHFPHISRIILSGYSDKETILCSARTAHQFLAKPCDPHTLIQAIRKSYSLHDLINNKDVIQMISQIDRLPSLPKVYSELQGEINSNRVSLKRIGDLIAQDVAMSSKVLQLVNSAFFSSSKRITSPQQAAVILGVDTLKSLVLYIHIFKQFKNWAHYPLETLMEHSVKTGELANKIAYSEFQDKALANEAFTAGLLHDVGKLILLQIPNYYRDIENLMFQSGCSYTEAEYELFGTSHAEVGAHLLSQWGIPNSIVEVVAFHHQLSDLDHIQSSLVAITHVADVLANSKESGQGLMDGAIDTEYLSIHGFKNRLPEWIALAEPLNEA
jgi:putative nucleotidyltransferase with HDIG domain